MVVLNKESVIYYMNEEKSKYKNKKKLVNGILFDSQKEAKRYLELKEWEEEDIISNLQTQVKFELQPKYRIGLKAVRGIFYVCDFCYYQNGIMIVEDVKGFKTDIYKLKKKMFEYKYGIELKEV